MHNALAVIFVACLRVVQATQDCALPLLVQQLPATRILSPVTTCPGPVEIFPSNIPYGVYTTIYTTTFDGFCPTGIRPHTYTITEECTGLPTPLPSGHVPTGFVQTVSVCETCGGQPITATLTVPYGNGASIVGGSAINGPIVSVATEPAAASPAYTGMTGSTQTQAPTAQTTGVSAASSLAVVAYTGASPSLLPIPLAVLCMQLGLILLAFVQM